MQTGTVRKRVSVPLRGKGRDQPQSIRRKIYSRRYVSVPLRGKGRDQRLGCTQLFLGPKERSDVSVPLRGKGRDQLSRISNPRVCIRGVSVPLRGKGRDQHDVLHVVEVTVKGGVSVPLRGKGRDQHDVLHVVEVTVKGGVSVPLRGKGRDQLFATKRSVAEKIMFPSPCGEKVGINPTLGKA